MSAKLWRAGTSNAFNTTLNGNIVAGDTTIALTTTSGLQAPGVLVIDRRDANNTATPNLREYVSFTDISSNNITGVTRGLGGSSAQSHLSGAIVEEVLSVTQWNDLLDFLQVAHDSAGNIVAAGTASIATARIHSLLNASGASILGNFPIHPVWVAQGMLSGATVGIGKPLPMPQNGVWEFFSATTRTPASLATLTIDINKNFGSVFSDQGTRLFFPLNGTFVSTASIGTKSFNRGDIFTVDVDNGSLASDLTVLGRGQ
jgi:hypothetical protein